ncbi:MFS transporter [Halomicrococcus sp. NG-SE-24]|uniref:MFS transporter n=1 Tax=Halomicrococcus sp. NG-SE-24 TaxID=3436928 RepID=UPI003D99B1AE
MTSADPAVEEPSLWLNSDFRRFFAGQFVTNAGDSLYTVAVLWLVFELSGSTVLTGIANALLLLPWLLQIPAGPIVDRLPLKPVLVGSQVLQGIVVLALPLAAATGRLSVGVLLAVIPVLTLATLLMAPMQTALVPRIVADTRLSRANSALATVTLGLDMVFDALGGPAVYGLLLGALGISRLVGSLVAPYLENVAYGRLELVGHSLAACCWLAAVYTPSTAFTVVLFGLAWVPAGISGVLTSTLNQTVFPADLLGRVLSIKGTASGTTLPFGSLVGGIVAEMLGTTTMGLAAFGFGFTGLYILVRPRLRQLPLVGDADPAAFDVTTSSGRNGE